MPGRQRRSSSVEAPGSLPSTQKIVGKHGGMVPKVFIFFCCLVMAHYLVIKQSSMYNPPPPHETSNEGHGGLVYDATATNTRNEDGWKQINVFYGKPDHLQVGGEKKQWFSQAKQDETVWNFLGQLEGGYFVDLAANDATVLSNSFSLERNHGWNGLCLEANPKYWSRLAYRQCIVVGAIVGSKRMEEIQFNFGKRESMQVPVGVPEMDDKGTLGGIVDEKFDNRNPNENRNVIAKRYTVTLAEIFERHHVPKVIDYFSLDVEGAESFIMSTFPFDHYVFRVLTVERPKPDLKQLLLSKGYIYKMRMSGFGEELWYHPDYIKKA